MRGHDRWRRVLLGERCVVATRQWKFRVVLGTGCRLRWSDIHRHCVGTLRRLRARSEEHTSELQSLAYLVCRLLLEKKTNSRIANPVYQHNLVAHHLLRRSSV